MGGLYDEITGTGALVGVSAAFGNCNGEQHFLLGYVAPVITLLEHDACEDHPDHGGLLECPR